jgi:hypothetical protein
MKCGNLVLTKTGVIVGDVFQSSSNPQIVFANVPAKRKYQNEHYNNVLRPSCNDRDKEF